VLRCWTSFLLGSDGVANGTGMNDLNAFSVAGSTPNMVSRRSRVALRPTSSSEPLLRHRNECDPGPGNAGLNNGAGVRTAHRANGCRWKMLGALSWS